MTNFRSLAFCHLQKVAFIKPTNTKLFNYDATLIKFTSDVNTIKKRDQHEIFPDALQK